MILAKKEDISQMFLQPKQETKPDHLLSVPCRQCVLITIASAQ